MVMRSGSDRICDEVHGHGAGSGGFVTRTQHRPLPGPPHRHSQPRLQHLPRRQRRQVLGHVDPARLQLQQLDLLLALPGAEDQPERRKPSAKLPGLIPFTT